MFTKRTVIRTTTSDGDIEEVCDDMDKAFAAANAAFAAADIAFQKADDAAFEKTSAEFSKAAQDVFATSPHKHTLRFRITSLSERWRLFRKFSKLALGTIYRKHVDFHYLKRKQ